MMFKKLIANPFRVGPALAAVLAAGILVSCVGDNESTGHRDSDIPGQVATEQRGEGQGEHGGSREGAGGEGHGPEGGGEGSEGAEGGGESNEAAMSSPIIPLGQTWDGVLGGLAVSARFDEATGIAHATVQNTLSDKLCYVQAEPHLKAGTTTVGELGPDRLGDLNPGQQATSSLAVADEPGLAGVAYDGYVVHMEVFDCSGPGPVAHSGEGSESGGGEEGSGAMLAPDQTFDMVRGGARLVLSYDASINAFTGTVENTTTNVLTRVRIEVHLSNGTELGPTTPVDMAPGEVIAVHMPATAGPFSGWVPHAEVGSGESGGEHGSGGRESGGEHGSGGEGSGGGS